MSDASLYPEPQTGELVTWLTSQLHTPPDNWHSIGVSLRSHDIPGGYTVCALAYDPAGKVTPLPRNQAEVRSNVGHPTPFQKWLAAATGTPIGKVPARAVLVQVIRHVGAEPEVHIQMETDDLEKWDTVRHGRDISEVLRPAAA